MWSVRQLYFLVFLNRISRKLATLLIYLFPPQQIRFYFHTSKKLVCVFVCVCVCEQYMCKYVFRRQLAGVSFLFLTMWFLGIVPRFSGLSDKFFFFFQLAVAFWGHHAPFKPFFYKWGKLYSRDVVWLLKILRPSSSIISVP